MPYEIIQNIVIFRVKIFLFNQSSLTISKGGSWRYLTFHQPQSFLNLSGWLSFELISGHVPSTGIWTIRLAKFALDKDDWCVGVKDAVSVSSETFLLEAHEEKTIRKTCLPRHLRTLPLPLIQTVFIHTGIYLLFFSVLYAPVSGTVWMFFCLYFLFCLFVLNQSYMVYSQCTTQSMSFFWAHIIFTLFILNVDNSDLIISSASLLEWLISFSFVIVTYLHEVKSIMSPWCTAFLCFNHVSVLPEKKTQNHKTLQMGFLQPCNHL